MTRYVVDIDEIVLRGVAHEEGDGLAGRVEQRLQALLAAGPDAVRRAAAPEQGLDLADLVAHSIWAEVHGALPIALAGAPTAGTTGADR